MTVLDLVLNVRKGENRGGQSASTVDKVSGTNYPPMVNAAAVTISIERRK
jgi:hypothetical protein